jgi:hypothetical protein
MNIQSANERSSSIYDNFKDDVCESCKIKINEKLSKYTKLDMALLMARPKNIHKKLGICQDCINKIHRKILDKAKYGRNIN